METESQIIEREIGTNGATYQPEVLRRLLDEDGRLTPADGYAILRSLPQISADERQQFYTDTRLAMAREEVAAHKLAGNPGSALERTWMKISHICDQMKEAFDTTLTERDSAVEEAEA